MSDIFPFLGGIIGGTGYLGVKATSLRTEPDGPFERRDKSVSAAQLYWPALIRHSKLACQTEETNSCSAAFALQDGQTQIKRRQCQVIERTQTCKNFRSSILKTLSQARHSNWRSCVTARPVPTKTRGNTNSLTAQLRGICATQSRNIRNYNK